MKDPLEIKNDILTQSMLYVDGALSVMFKQQCVWLIIFLLWFITTILSVNIIIWILSLVFWVIVFIPRYIEHRYTNFDSYISFYWKLDEEEYIEAKHTQLKQIRACINTHIKINNIVLIIYTIMLIIYFLCMLLCFV